MENLPATQVNVKAADLFNAQMPATTEGAPRDMAAVATSAFIPTLTIAYGLSESVKKRVAQLGEFVLAGQTSLGPKIEVIFLQYRIHACRVKNKSEIVDHCFHITGSIQNDPEYQKYISAKQDVGVELVQGTDLLFWIPAANAFAVFYCKKTLASYAMDIYRQGAGGHLVGIETVLAENRNRTRSWYNLLISPLNRAVKGSPCGVPEDKKDIEIPGELLSKTYAMFMNPASGAGVEKAADGTERDR